MPPPPPVFQARREFSSGAASDLLGDSGRFADLHILETIQRPWQVGRRSVRPENQATLHFFWLCLAFFGTLTFSFSRLDRLDWYFYWADVVATLLLAPTTTELSAFPLSQPNLVQRESTRSSWLSTSRYRTVAPRPVESGVWT